MPDISVIIPSYNARDLLLECLESLEKNSLDRERFEVIVIDDGSTDDTKKMINEYRRRSTMNIVYLLRDRSNECGPGPARNEGLTVARGRIIAFTDADCRPDSGWLVAIERAILKNGHATVSGLTYCDDVLLFPWKMSPAGQVGVTANFAFDREQTKPTKFSLSYKGLVGDDTDFRLRLMDNHEDMYIDNSMRVFHAPRYMTLRQVIRRSVYRMHDVQLVKHHGKTALYSMHPIFQPWLFGRISSISIITVAFLGVLLLLLQESWFWSALLISAALFYFLFLLVFYRFCIMYVPKNPRPVTLCERVKTLVALTVYIPCILVARIAGSIRYRHFML